MATESASQTPVDDKIQSGESGKAVEVGGAQETKDVTKEKDGNWPFANSEPMREDQVQNAVKFLSHPKVRGSPVMYRRSFLERKGLTKEEIDEAFRRVPDPPSQESSAKAIVPTQERQSMPQATLQSQSPAQALQHLTGPSNTVSTAAMAQPSRFQWTHMLLAVGLLTATGAGTGVVFKNAVIPRMKSWIRRIAAEGDESEQKKALEPSPVEEAVAAAKAAATAAAEVANASKEMLKLKLEDSKHLEGLMHSLEDQMEEMKSMKIALQDIEKQKHEFHIARGRPDEQITSETNKGKSNSAWGAVSSINQVEPGGVSQTISKNFRADATLSSLDQGLVRPSSAPASVEPSQAPYSKSYVELMAMVQRGEKPPGIKEVNDKPPNPNQPPSNSRLQPRPKPWEAIQAQSNNDKQGTNAQYFQTMNLSAVRDGSKPVGNGFSNIQPRSTNPVTVRTPDNHEAWWRTKKNEPELKPDNRPPGSNVRITEMESNDEEIYRGIGRELPSGSLGRATVDGPGGSSLHGSSERTWVPPPPPPVAMAQAAEAIWKPKSKTTNEDVDATIAMPESSESVLRPEFEDDRFMPHGTMIEQEQHVSSSSEVHNITENNKEEMKHVPAFTEQTSYEEPLYNDIAKESVEEKEDVRV
uniref:Peroxisomal membrane protein PEX14 n=1 Tax=Wollemia nobilis TaxID=56998 RepID=A0A0C9RPY9_9CONI